MSIVLLLTGMLLHWMYPVAVWPTGSFVPRILIHETFKKNKNKEYFDFYVEIGSEINISTVNSIFLDNLKA